MLLHDTEALDWKRAAVPSWEQGREFGSQPVEMRPHYSPQLQLYKSLQMLHQQTALQPLCIPSKRNETGKWLCSREVPRTEDFATVAGCCRVWLIFFFILDSGKDNAFNSWRALFTLYMQARLNIDRQLQGSICALSGGLHHLFLPRQRLWIIQDKCSSSSLIKLTLFGF